MAFTMVLLAIAAAVALMLGVIGIYGVMSYIVSQRRAEIGLRLALGAEPRRVVGMIVRQGGLVTLAGIAAGLAAAFAGSRLLGSLLYEVSPRDPASSPRPRWRCCRDRAARVLAARAPRRHVNPLEALRAE